MIGCREIISYKSIKLSAPRKSKSYTNEKYNNNVLIYKHLIDMVGGVRRGAVIPLQYYYDISVIMHLGRYIWILGIIYNVKLYDS